jgi:hypothetical protein
MALSFHSIYSRKLGVDRSGYITGETGIKMPQVYVGAQGSEVAIYGSTSIQTLSSAAGSTATQITAGGVTQLNSSGALTWTMAPPIAGLRKTIVQVSTAASGALTVRLSTSLGGNFVSTLGSSFQAIALLSQWTAVTLTGLSTSYWLVTTNTSSAAMTT